MKNKIDDWISLVPNCQSETQILNWESAIHAKDWVRDIDNMHHKYDVHRIVRSLDKEQLRTFLKFRLDFLNEELRETEKAAYDGDEIDCEEVVDGLIDLCVVAIGTLNLFGVDSHWAWEEVHKANMNKEVGIKEGRDNPLGLPDLCKPKDWQPPSHAGNHGLLTKLNES